MSSDFARPRSSDRNASAFDGSHASKPTVHTKVGVRSKKIWDNGKDEIIQHNPSMERLGAGLITENRGSSMTAPARLSSSSTLLNDNSFEIENYDNLSEELRLNPLIEIGEPNAYFSFTHSFEEHNDSSIYSEHPNLRGNIVSEVTRHDKNTERKPAAIDSMVFNQQRRHSSKQHLESNTQTSNMCYQNSNQTLQQKVEAEEKLKDRISFRNMPVERRLHQSLREKEVEKFGMKAPPVAPYAGGNRRSNRIITQTLKNEVRSKRMLPSSSELARSQIRAVPKLNAAGSQKRTSVLPMELVEKQLKEVTTPRKTGALQTWLKRLNELIEFKDTNGHANVPQQYAKNHSLGIWVNKQRMEKKAFDERKPSSLTADKIQLLEDAGFVWAKRKGQAAWEDKFRELQDFQQKNGHCNVPTKNKANRALGRWVSTQRANYKKSSNGESHQQPRMDCVEFTRRIRRLDAIGFTWSLIPTKSDVHLEKKEIGDAEIDRSPSSVKTGSKDELDHEKNRGTT
eukprot:CAMPEP_0197179274 /NCGR_PEP_ID=MMETSP1423-20130617/4287_1 /TAXON_ID=476441 /ORGANISM="Pseudo-nitzschia heimii, Strain UNC1101" /LENGTH=511 /DNA_ID=CAMNT_0042629165 /DNA_START=407 /DNA_END=1942 /DNA_ORIENTATION=-